MRQAMERKTSGRQELREGDGHGDFDGDECDDETDEHEDSEGNINENNCTCTRRLRHAPQKERANRK